ncbi:MULTISPECIES: hypothetical protein [Streptomyces]|uniref:Uncharacterized protein n=1 Tax=Streptomyces demainii TaxID=588122 RepID=A0ABT9KHI5_9ACTN|nr:hypothetical protein [Streptomyces demainii]MDP9607859.1 hypothetical protein [Streptomyces demainii]
MIRASASSGTTSGSGNARRLSSRIAAVRRSTAVAPLVYGPDRVGQALLLGWRRARLRSPTGAACCW